MVLVRCEAAGHKDADVKLFSSGMLLGFVEAGLKILKGLRTLQNHLINHGFLLPRGESICEPRGSGLPSNE
jgi:hypothetical protein